MSRPLQQKNTRSLVTWLPLVMLAGSVFLYIILLTHIRHMKHQQLALKQENIWRGYVQDTLHVPMRLPGEYEIGLGAVREELGDSADLSWLKQTHQLGERPHT